MNREKQLSREELKEIQIDILDYVSSFCEEKNINYWLDAGTLLGAIRHKGFIPWDDDIDIGMLRNDYEIFKREFKNDTKYRFICHDNDKNFLCAFGKVMDTDTIMYDSGNNKTCVNIDIFVLDNVPDEEKEFEKVYRKRNFYMIFNGAKIGSKGANKTKNIIRKFIKILILPFPRDYFVKKIIKNAMKYRNENTNRVANLSAKGYWKHINKNILDKFEYKEFEGKKYKVPSKYDYYLRTLYGDYMKLPPEKDRIAHHFSKAYKKY